MDGVSFAIMLAPFGVFVWAVSHGFRHFRGGTNDGYVRLAFFSTGVLGLFVQTACGFFAAFDDPHGRLVDCIDWGAWTGTPTPLVAFLYLLATVLLVALIGFYTCGSIVASLRITKAPARPKQ
jgi:hypothetical protein